MLRPIGRALAKRGVNNASFASLYYSLGSSAFSREQRAFLYGQKQFLNAATTSNLSKLRRNTHRIEKGIISRPRRDVFALDYIEETVDAYQQAISEDCSSDVIGVAWAHDVLTEYFSITDSSHKVLGPLGERFSKLGKPPAACKPDRSEATRTPYNREPSESVPTYDSLLALAKQRRSVRWFKDEPVPRELLLKALSVATLSPSACNRQPFQFRIFDDPKLLREVAALPAGTAGYHQNFPCVVVVVGRMRYYFDERDRHLIYIDGSLAAMSFVLALETLGLSSCCINWPDIEAREIAAAKLLKLEPDERPVMFIAVGFADPTGLIPYSEKTAPDRLCRFNFEPTDASP